jgi:endonuclease/exonuclease/phosphatase family metal-dependent hydrolase
MKSFTFKVLTYNIHKGFDMYNQNFVLHEIRKQIQAIDVDAVFLQEVLGQHQQHEDLIIDWPEVPPLEFLADQIWPHYAYGKNAIYSEGHHGNAILSKHSIEHWKNINVSRFKKASRSLLHGIIHVPDTDLRIHFICVHLELIGFERKRQLNILKQYVNSIIPDKEPLIIAGDFNDWNSRTGLHLESDLTMQEVFHLKQGHYSRTYPSIWPMLRMDRIYFRNIELIECECLRDSPWKQMSDHLPLYAHFKIQL